MSNCMYSILNTGNGFKNGTSVAQVFTTNTVQPTLFQFRIKTGTALTLTNCFLVYDMEANTRSVLYYDPSGQK
jgi:hypothetical protein